MERIDIQSVLAKIQTEIGCACEVYEGIGNDHTICIPPDKLRAVIDVLNDHFDCYHLSGITAQQRADQTDQIEVIYNFWKGVGISLLMKLPVKSPELQSIISFLPGADFYEREVAEMFGVAFTGRTETPPLLLPDDWDQGPPFIRNEVNDG